MTFILRRWAPAVVLSLSATVSSGLLAGRVLAQTATASPDAAVSEATASTPVDNFSLDKLIGDAVSLSNQSYPEIEKAIQRFKNNDGEGCREYLDLAKQKYPKLPPVDVLFARLHYAAGNIDAGRFWLESAATKDPNDPEAYLLLADLSFSEGRTAEAGALFEKAQALSAKFNDNAKRKRNFDIRVLAGSSAVQERRQSWAEAGELLKKWIALDPDSAPAHQRYGVVLFRLKNLAEAFNQFSQARKLNPDANNPNVMLGQLHAMAGEKDAAKAAFEKAYAEEPGNEGTARSYAEWLVQEGDLTKAQSVSAALRKKSPESINALLLDGLVAKMRGDRKAAEEALTKAIGVDPANAGATNLLALLLIESTADSDREKALRYAQINAERFANSAQAQVTLAWVLYQLGRNAEGDAALGRGAQAGQLSADSAYLVARILVQKGRKDQARGALEAMLKQIGAGTFMYRKEAEALLKELQSAGVTAPGAGPATPATNPAIPALPTAPK
jgi:tetratricopeptide (TPR) repeat protein